MALIFLSYSRDDAPLAACIRAKLEQRTGHQIFLDDAARGPGVIPGDVWRDALYRGLRSAAAVIFLASPAANASTWCAAELAIARFRRIPILPVTASPTCKLPSIIDDMQAIKYSASADDVVARIADALSTAGIRYRLTGAWDGTRPPYPGLGAFGAEDGAVFFGRDADRDSMLLTFDGVGDAGRVIVLHGPSGSGKSSFLSASLLPTLDANGWSIRGPLDASRTDVTTALQNLPNPDRSRALVAVDQAERLVNGSLSADISDAFMTAVSSAREAGWWQLFVLRTEFTIPPERGGGLLGMVDTHLTLGLLNRSRLREAIVEPGNLAGIVFDEQVVEAMLDATVGTESLPLLAYTLNHIWTCVTRDGRPTGTVTMADYGDGVEGTLVRQAEAAYGDLTPEQRSQVVPTFARLVSVRPHQPPTSAPIDARALSPAERQVLVPFWQRRLVVDVELDAQGSRPDGHHRDSARRAERHGGHRDRGRGTSGPLAHAARRNRLDAE